MESGIEEPAAYDEEDAKRHPNLLRKGPQVYVPGVSDTGAGGANQQVSRLDAFGRPNLSNCEAQTEGIEH